MPTYTTYTIDPLTGGTVATPTTANAAVDMLDARFQQAEDALNDLSGRIETLNTKSAIIRQHVPLATGVYTGALVYYDTAAARFDLAQALTLAETTESGNTVEAPQARVEGIIIGLDAGGGDSITGTMLCGGYWEDLSIANVCLGQNASAGIYYLSPVTAGKATQNTYGHLRQPVLSYYGAGKFSLSIFYMAHDNHFHSTQVLDGQWLQVAGSTVADIAPEGAQYVYGGTYSYGLGAIGDTTALFWNGVLQDTISGSTAAKFAIESDNIWYMDNTQPAAGSVTIFNHYPFAYDTAVVRSVTSADDSITVTNTNGLITIKGNDFVNGEVAKSSYAVSSVAGNTMTFTPVTTDVVAGPGIVVNKALDGSAYISAASRIGSLMDAYSINHNGTTVISNGIYQYITFPAGRKSNFVMTMPITDITSPCSIAVWGIKIGSNGVQLGVKAQFIPDPTTDTPSSIPSDLYTGSLTFTNGDASNSLVYGEVAITGCTATGNGMLIATVELDSTGSNAQIQLLRTGFKLTTIAANTPIASDDMNSITQQFVVGDTAIEAGTAVMILNGTLVPCVNVEGGLNDTTNKCVGVAVEGAGAGAMLTYMITGTMTYIVNGAVPGQSLYIGTDGKLTTVSDVDTFLVSARYLQKVGTVLTGNKIQVNIESAVQG